MPRLDGAVGSVLTKPWVPDTNKTRGRRLDKVKDIICDSRVSESERKNTK